jgi:hypothetical protein
MSDERKEIEQILKDRLVQSIKTQGEKTVAQNLLSTSSITVDQFQRLLNDINGLKQKINEIERNMKNLKNQQSGARKWV